MQAITYSTRLICDEAQKEALMEILRLERELFNFCSKKFFGQKVNSITAMHKLCYQAIKQEYSRVKSQIIIRAEQSCLVAYRSIKSNKHKIEKPPVKNRLCIQLDKRLYVLKGKEILLTTLDRRIKCKFVEYDRLTNLLDKYTPSDPKLFVCDGEIYISFTFLIPTEEKSSGLVLGIDLGYRRYAATSEGKLFIDKKYNQEKRKLRYLKRCLQSKLKKSRTAIKHLVKLRKKENNQSRNFNHHLANSILKTKCNVIAVENLNVKRLKSKKHNGKSRSRKTQVSLGVLRTFLTYKAALLGKRVVCVNPKNTSQRDCLTGQLEGVRQGCRFYAKSGLVYDSDINAAINIAKLTKLPVSQGNPLDGQAVVNRPLRHNFLISSDL